jgi:hydrogenase maturation protein HypF
LQQVLVPSNGSSQRLRLAIQGAVQGVGFRPFLLRLATELSLVGWVCNTARGVLLEVEGDSLQLQDFLARLEQDKPVHADIQGVESAFLEPAGYTTFQIRPSDGEGAKRTLILPDYATCRECVREIFEPKNRRYQYPFTNCTHCGPRFSIIEALPYDRPNTTMRGFTMCPACRVEYENPLDRRFHAQPNACPRCGPQLELWDAGGKILAIHHQALLQAADLLRGGAIVAVKGLGGFHLLVDARLEDAVRALRSRKGREAKPFALMCPNLEAAKRLCEVSAQEEELLCSPESPIVCLRRLPASAAEVAPSVAPDNPYLGIMLPYTPLHHLLMDELGVPIVATSGNLSEEPICTDEHEAIHRLAGLAEVFLVHNRPIARHVDDSVVRVLLGRELVLRRARGYAPLPIRLAEPIPSVLAVGAHLKNTIALSLGRDVFVSQHIGDLETAQAFAAFQEVGKSLRQMYDLRPSAVVCDRHPDYLSTQFAQKSGLPLVAVQHHYAHVLACMAENHLNGTVLGVSWDGTGYGLDHTIWGGEFIRVTQSGFHRVAHLRTFSLPGGEKAVRQPRRTALGLLYEIFGGDLFTMRHLAPLQAFTPAEVAVLRTMLQKNINTPRTSSAGRLFDAIAALIGLHEIVQFEGQAAQHLEFALDGIETNERYNVDILDSSASSLQAPLIVDWAPLVRGMLDDIRRRVERGRIAAKFHNTLVEAIITVARRVGEERVVLTGGCFQNKYLTERAVNRLQSEHFCAYWHRQIPPHDGGIAVGQIVAAARERLGDQDHVLGSSRKTLEHSGR